MTICFIYLGKHVQGNYKYPPYPEAGHLAFLYFTCGEWEGGGVGVFSCPCLMLCSPDNCFPVMCVCICLMGAWREGGGGGANILSTRSSILYSTNSFLAPCNFLRKLSTFFFVHKFGSDIVK